MTIDADDLQQYLDANIPITRAMGATVVEAGRDGVRVAAPLAPNTNHRDTVFGGSAAAIAILAAWALLHLRLVDEGIVTRLVIQKSRMHYAAPITGDFFAVSAIPDEGAWERFLTTLARKGRARISVSAALYCGADAVASFDGEFVALADSAD